MTKINAMKAVMVILGIVGSYVFLLNLAFGQGLWH